MIMNESENKFPLIGDKFPEIEVQTTFGMKSLPNDYKGNWLVLFSHPADFTPVCTTEFYSFAKRKEEFTIRVKNIFQSLSYAQNADMK